MCLQESSGTQTRVFIGAAPSGTESRWASDGQQPGSISVGHDRVWHAPPDHVMLVGPS